MNSPKLDWGYHSEPEPHLDNRRLHCPRGKGLGGSSAVNGMVYVRGNPNDFDRWEAMGAQGWSYADVLPYFRRAESFAQYEAGDPYRGSQGPLSTRNGDQANPLYAAFLSAAEQAGHPLSKDLNGQQQEGFGPLPMTVGHGTRRSTDRAYLAAALARPNLQVLTHTHAHKLLIKAGQAIGVEVSGRDGKLAQHQGGELLLCTGAIASPALLQRSGIGPADLLQPLGLEVQQNLPGVGANLMDHLEVYLQQGCRQPVSLQRDLSWFGKLRIGLQWLATRKGLGATNHFEVGGFIRSAPDIPWPDIQFHFLPVAMSYDGSSFAGEHGFQVHVGPMLSPSRGSVTIQSADPFAAPRIAFNYMSDPQDWSVFRSAIRQARTIFDQAALAPFRGDEISPGAMLQSDADLDAFIVANAESAYHPCGTCKMGEDNMAVTNAQGQVHGVANLRVVDASLFPHITNGNLNAPTIMAAEKIAAGMA